MAQAPKNMAPCGRADTLLGFARGQRTGINMGYRTKRCRGRVQSGKGRGRQRSSAGLPATSRVWSNLGPGPRDQRREALGGKRALCVLGSCTPYSPSTMTSRAEMTVSSCKALRQGRGEIYSEGGHPPPPAWSGEENCVYCGSPLSCHTWWLGCRSQGW